MRLEPLTLVLDGAVPIPTGAIVAYLATRPREAKAFVADLADAIIQEQDRFEPDPDLEDGDVDAGIDDLVHDAEEDACDCEDMGGEPLLGAPEVEFTVRGLPERRGHINQRRWWDGGAANDDGEPTLGQPEIGARFYVGRDAWFAGYQRNPEHEECEGGADDDKGIDDEPHDGEDVADADSDDLGGEPTLGAPENPHDQNRWWQGGLGCHEGDHNSERNSSRYSAEHYTSRDAARRQAREMVEGHRRSHRRHAPDTITFYAKPMMIGGVLVVGEIHG